MNSIDFNQQLDILGLKQTDVATLLRVTPRAVRRWQSGEQEIPGFVDAVFDVWRQLHARKIPWGADIDSLMHKDYDQIDRHREHDQDLKELLDRVEARGGPAAPWRVNLREHTATLGRMTVGFYKLRSGGFSLANYRRGDQPPDTYRDRPLIEDAVAAFAAAIEKARTERPEQEWDE